MAVAKPSSYLLSPPLECSTYSTSPPCVDFGIEEADPLGDNYTPGCWAEDGRSTLPKFGPSLG
jgi:hypothetical protein